MDNNIKLVHFVDYNISSFWDEVVHFVENNIKLIHFIDFNKLVHFMDNNIKLVHFVDCNISSF